MLNNVSLLKLEKTISVHLQDLPVLKAELVTLLGVFYHTNVFLFI